MENKYQRLRISVDVCRRVVATSDTRDIDCGKGAAVTEKERIELKD